MISSTLPAALLVALPGAWFGHANPISHVPGAALLFPAALFWIALKASSPGAAFRSGWICAALAYAACLYWVFIPVHVHGGLPWILALPCPILLGMYLGLYGGVFSALIHWARPVISPAFLGLGAGLLWGGVEMAQGTLFTGFSWLTLPAGLAPWPATIQGLALVGEYWLSVVFVAAAAWLILARESTFSLLLGIATPLILIGFGVMTLAKPLPEGEPIRVTLVQGNIDQTVKWEPEYQEATVRAYLDLTAKELSSAPELVIWPETAMPFYLQEENTLSRQVRDFVRSQERFALLTGAPRYEVNLSTGEIGYANSAFLLGPRGETIDVYDKEHLVPFGEYVPLGHLLPFIRRLAQSEGDFVAGNDPAPIHWDRLALGMLICYEAIFTGLSRERVRAGANLLVNISNDAWFGRSSAPRQHLNQAVLRSVEQGRFLVRSTNTGVTAIIDPRGRRLEAGGLFHRLTLSYPEVLLLEDRTFYHRHYTFLQALLPATVGVLLGSVWWLRRRRASFGME